MMPQDFRRDRTATGKLSLIWGDECEATEFPARAQILVEHFGMTVTDTIVGFDELMWITKLGNAQFCISWDVWFPEVSIMAWKDTPDSEVERLVSGD